MSDLKSPPLPALVPIEPPPPVDSRFTVTTVTEATHESVSRRTKAGWHQDGWFYDADCEGTIGGAMTGPFATEDAAHASIDERIWLQRGCRLYPAVQVPAAVGVDVRRLLRANAFHIVGEGLDETVATFALGEQRSLRPAPDEIPRALALLVAHDIAPEHVRVPVRDTNLPVLFTPA